MESATSKSIEKNKKIALALRLNSNYIIPNLCQLLGNRQTIAQLILQSKGEDKELYEQYFDRVNDEIKKYLGV